MKIVLEINDNKLSFFMELIKNLGFIKSVKTSNPEEKRIGQKKPKMLHENRKDKSFTPGYPALDYSKYCFDNKDLKFDRSEIHDRI